MKKPLMLSLPLSLSLACTMPDTSQLESASTCADADCGCPEPEGPTCIVDGLVVELDEEPANLDDDDGKVTFCHATSSATNPFVLITTSIYACKAHDAHTKLSKGGTEDVFGTDGCED